MHAVFHVYEYAHAHVCYIVCVPTGLVLNLCACMFGAAAASALAYSSISYLDCHHVVSYLQPNPTMSCVIVCWPFLSTDLH